MIVGYCEYNGRTFPYIEEIEALEPSSSWTLLELLMVCITLATTPVPSTHPPYRQIEKYYTCVEEHTIPSLFQKLGIVFDLEGIPFGGDAEVASFLTNNSRYFGGVPIEPRVKACTFPEGVIFIERLTPYIFRLNRRIILEVQDIFEANAALLWIRQENIMYENRNISLV